MTDPRLFDQPLVPLSPNVTQQLAVTHQLQAAAPAPQPQPRPAFDTDDLLVDDDEPRYPGLAPVSVRTDRRIDEIPLMPRVGGPSLFGSAPGVRRESATGPIELPKPTGSPLGAFVRSREAALAAAAVAVVGAVSGAAAIMPTGNPEAQAAAGPMTSPVPQPSGSAVSDGQVCFSKTEILRAMRHHHHRKHQRSTPRATVTVTALPSAGTQVPIKRPVRPGKRPTATTNASSGGSAAPSRPAVGAVVTTGLDLRGIVADAGQGKLLGLNTGTYVLKDFDSQLMGANLRNGGLKGAGTDETVIAMATRSSTKAGSVPTKDYTTNQLYIVSSIGGTPGLSDFWLKGTDQGHLFNGLRIGQASNARVSNVKITDIPGNKSFPPGETFALNDWRTNGSVYENVSIDGGGTSAVDFGSNSSTNITVNKSTFTGTAHSSAMAMWQTKHITLNDVTIKNNRSGINFERASGNITLNRPVFSNNRMYDMQFGTDQEGGNVVINNPVLAPGQKLKINAPIQYHGGTNGQKRANIHVYVNGVDKTSQLVQFL